MLGYDNGDRQMSLVQDFVCRGYLALHDWKPGQPIELLPALRACYPGCLNDSILSVQLWREESPGDRHDAGWMFQIIRPMNDVFRCSVLPISEENDDNYDYSDHPWNSIPDDLIQAVLKPDRFEAWQQTFDIFKPEMFELMCRHRNDAKGLPGEAVLGYDNGGRQMPPTQDPDWRGYMVQNDWKPGQPIELLPVLHAYYPGCLDDSVLSVQLWCQQTNSDEGVTDWGLQIMRSRSGVLRFPMPPASDGFGDNIDFSWKQRDKFPSDLIGVVLWRYPVELLQETFGIFKPEMVKLISQHRYEAAFDAERKAGDSSNERANFLLEAVNLLSGELASQIDLKLLTIRELKGESAFGLRAEENESRWVEIGTEAYQPSPLLYEETKSQVVALVEECFWSLPRALQVAIWFSHVSEMFPGGNEIDHWDAPRGTIHDMRLFDVHEVFDSVANSVMSAAGEEYGNAVMDGLR